MSWFGPFGSMTWAASIWLNEFFQWRKCSWWWDLRRELKQEFRDLDPYRLVMKLRGPYHMGSLAFGETPPSSVAKILNTINLPKGSRVVDFGAGRGMPCLTAAALGYRSLGLEYFQVYTERSQRVAQRLNLEATFESGNFLDRPLPEADLYLVSTTAFPEETRQQLLTKLLEVSPNAWVVTQDWILGPPFVNERLQELPVSWGTAKFCFQRLGAGSTWV